MSRSWSGKSFASGLMRINCAALLLLAQYWVTAKKAQAEPPATYTWQIERMELGGNGAHLQVLRENDVIVAYQDAPIYLFPCVVRSLQVACTVPPGQYHYPLRVSVAIYNAMGVDPRYVSNHEVVITPWGFNEIPLTDMHDMARNIDGPVVLDYWDWFGTEGFGFFVGLWIHGLVYDPAMTNDSPNLTSGLTNVFPGFNMLGREGAWYWMDEIGLPGNMGVRAVIEPFCPKLVGDINADADIDDTDLAYLTAGIQAGGDMFQAADSRRHLDLNNDWVLDAADTAILMENYTGADNRVAVPEIEILTPDIRHTFPVGYLAPDGVCEVRNRGVINIFPFAVDPPSGATIYPLHYSVTTNVPWLTVSPSSGTSTGDTQQIALHFATESLPTGEYQATIRVDGNAGNSPQRGSVTVLVQTTGDFDLDGDVDGDDGNLLAACATGPSIPYASDVLPTGCQMTRDTQGFLLGDLDRDWDIDQMDFGLFQLRFGASPNAIAQAMAQMNLTPTPASTTSQSTEPAWPEAYRDLFPNDGEVQTEASPVIAYLILGILLLVAGIIWWNWEPASSDSPFIRAGKEPDTTEIPRIKAAIDYLQELSHVSGAHPDIARAYAILHVEQFYDIDICACGRLLINRSPLGDGIDDTGEEGTAASVVTIPRQDVRILAKIVLRQNLVRPANWDQREKARLAFALLAEWEHAAYGPDEPTCHRALEDTVMSVKDYTGLLPGDLHFQHGAGEKSSEAKE